MFANATEAASGTLRVAQYRPCSSSPASILGVAFREACHDATPNAVNDLREATTNLVVRLRRDGASPERVIVALKEALTLYGGSRLPPSLVGPADECGEREAAEYRRVFAWCLDALW